ncbi:phage head completion protein [Brachyspira innocens]|nr:head-tail adaptor protein [Brachyspira innocens]
MKVGKLIHTITFYRTKYIDNGNGTGSNELIELRKVKCSIEDITYKDIQQGKRKDLERTLKVHTHYFKEFDTKGMMAKINRENDIYEVINMENVSYKNIECIFTIKKLVNNKKADNRE